MNADGCPKDRADEEKEKGGKGGEDGGAADPATDEGEEQAGCADEEDGEENDKGGGTPGMVGEEEALKGDDGAKKGKQSDGTIDMALPGCGRDAAADEQATDDSPRGEEWGEDGGGSEKGAGYGEERQGHAVMIAGGEGGCKWCGRA